MMDYAVIMAGGTGKRLWPLSRQKRPKQVLKLLDGQTLLRRCFERLRPIFDLRNIIVLTNAGYADVVRENLSELPSNNVIAEPAVRDTAGAIGLASTVLAKYDSEATITVVTADQIIANLVKNAGTAKAVLRAAVRSLPIKRDCECESALKNALVTAQELVPEKTLRELEPIVGRDMKKA